MKEELKNKNTNSLPSAEVEEIMGQIPPAILRYGLSVFMLVLIMLTSLAWFIRYPDTLQGEALLTSSNPPASIISRMDGKIISLEVSDSTEVDSGQILIVLGSEVSLDDIRAWKTYLLGLNSAIRNDSLWLIPNMPEPRVLNISVLQSPAAAVNAHWKTYCDLLQRESSFDQDKAESLHRRILELQDLISSLKRQIALLREEGKLTRNDYRRDSLIARGGGIAPVDLDASRKKVLQHKMELENTRARLAEVVIRKGEYDQQLSDFLSEAQKGMHTALRDLHESVGEALAACAGWEETHIYRSPIRGSVSLNAYWSKGQEVKSGDVMMNILPLAPGELIAKLRLPLRGSGRLEKGAEVSISLDDFPPMEYGIIAGRVTRISAIPDGGFLSVDAELTEGLLSSYGKKLEFRGSLSGKAEVRTKDARLLERIVRPLQYIIQDQKSQRE